MESFWVALEIVAPLFLLMAVGYLVQRTGLMSEPAVRQANKLVFKIFLPLLVFLNIYHTNLAESFQPALLLFSLIGVLLEFGISLLLVLKLEKENSKRGVMLQGMFRSNFVLFGIPVTTALFGDAAGIAAILVAVIIPLYNVLAVVSLELFNGGKPDGKKIFKGIVTNPLIIASAIGLLFLAFSWQLPTVVYKTVSDLSSIATPLAFVLLGATFRFGEVRQYAANLGLTVSFRLLIFPLILIGAAIFLGFRNAELAVLLTMFASPIAVSSFTMAQQMGGDDKLAGQLVVFTSVGSIVTIFFFIFALRQLMFL